MTREDLFIAVGELEEERLAAVEGKGENRKAGGKKSSKGIRLRKLMWVPAAAAVLLVGSIGLKMTGVIGGNTYRSSDMGSSISSGMPSYEPEEAYMEGAYGISASEDKSVVSDWNTNSNEIEADGDSVKTADTASVQKKLITTMTVSMETNTYDDTCSWIRRYTEQYGGYIEQEDSYSYVNSRQSCQFVLRIPADQLNLFVTGMNEIGNVTRSSVKTEDITLSYVDTESHINALNEEKNRLTELMKTAESLSDLLDIEDRLSTIRYELEYYESRLKVYDNQVSYSTLNLSVQEVQVYTEPEPETLLTRISDSFKGNLTFLKEAGMDLIVFVIGNLPVLLILAAFAAGCVLLIKKIRRKSGKN